MGYKSIDAATMIAISDPWADDSRDRPILLSHPLTAGLVPILDTAHNMLLRIQIIPSAKQKEMKTLSDRALELDVDFDDLLRTMIEVGNGWSAAAGEERRVMINTMVQTLWPEGLMGMQHPYLTEAGDVEISVSRLTPEIIETMESIVVEGRNLHQMFNEWVTVGRQLGEVERTRIRLGETEEEGAVTAGDVQQARYRWIRAANALSALLELESDFPETHRLRILQPLLAAEAKASKKRSAQKTDPTEVTETPDSTETVTDGQN